MKIGRTFSQNMDTCSNNSEAYKLAEMDFALWTDYLGDYIAMWQKNSSQFIQEQQHKMLGMAMCPFLFGVTQNLPEAWIKLLYNNGIIDKDRINKRTSLTASEMEMSDMAEVIFRHCYHLVENKKDLKTILNFIYEVEERSKLGNIDLSYALDEIGNKEVFKSMWAPLRKSYEHKKKQAYICIIYFFKTIHQHLVFYGRDGLDKAEYTKRKIAERNNYNREGYVDSELMTEQGDTAFKEGNFKQALELYTELIEIDPLNSHLYSSRAQTYLHLKKYWEAHCDNKRALLLDSTSAKNYFIAAKVYIEFGQLDKAQDMNKMALRIVKKINLRESIMFQAQEIEEAKQKISNARISDRPIISIEKGKENEPPEGKKIVEEFDKQLNRGFEAYNSAKYSKAISYLHSALSLVTQYGSEIVRVTKDDILVLNFLYAMSCIYSTLNIQSASDVLKSILREEIFPAAYYGLGVVSLLLCSYKEAENHLIHGLNILNAYNGKSYIWPHTVHVVQETDPSNLINLFQIRLKECIAPKPDGICRFHVDFENQDKKSVEIYQRCPDFKGSVTIHCIYKCVIDFHKACWKIFKQNYGDKITDKEMLDIKCPTPMCWGTICIVCITSPTSEIKQFTSAQNEKPTHTARPRVKLPTTSPNKILSKAEKKRLRKERRTQAKLEAQAALISSMTEPQMNDKVDVTVEGYVPDISQRAAPDCQVTLLKKDEPDLVVTSKQKSMKVKKKKEKVKNILPVDLQFAGDEERQRLSAYSLEEEEQSLNSEGIVSLADLPPPAAVIFPVKPDGSSSEPQYQLPRPASDDSTKDIFQLFENLVSNDNALDLHGSLVKDILQNLSNESRYKIDAAGGIACFLSSSPVFAVFRNQYVTLNPSLHRPAPEKTFSWENRKKTLEAIEQATLLKDVQKSNSLNPAAKEFVPHVKKGGYNELDTFELPEGVHLSALTPISLAPGKEGSKVYEVGFNSMINKKILKADSNKPVPYPPTKQSYHSLDEITLGKAVKSTKLSTIDSVDDHEEGEDEDDTFPAHRTNPNSDVSDFSCDRSVSPASTSSSVDRQKMQAVLPVPLKVPKFSLPTRGKKKALRPQLPSRHMPGYIAQKPPLSGESSVSSSIAADEDDRESLASTSDKDSITDQARASPGSLWTGKFSKSKTVLEDGAVSVMSEQKKPVRRDLFDSGVQNTQQMDPLYLPYNNTLEQQSTFSADIWSTNTSAAKKDDWPEQKFFPSFSQAPSVPSFTDVNGKMTTQKSRVLSQLASSQSLNNSYSISDKVENINVWGNFDGLSETSWTAQGLKGSTNVVTNETSDVSVHRATTPQDTMDHPVLSCKDPWNQQPQISATSSPLVKPSSLAPLDTTSMGWMLSGLQSTLDSPLITSSLVMPAQEYLLKLDSDGFSRTPGKRNPFSTSSKSQFFSSASDIKSGDNDSSILNDSQPFFPPSYLDKSEVNFSAKPLTVDMSIQTNPALLMASTQTDISGDITQKQKNEIKKEDICRIEQIAAMRQKEISDKIIKKLEDQLMKEKELRKNSELRIQLMLKEERVKWLEKHKEVAQKHIAHLRAALKSLTNSRDVYVKIEQKLRKWFVHYERCDITLSRSEEVKEEDMLTDIADNLQYYTSFISDLSDLAIQELTINADSSLKASVEDDIDNDRHSLRPVLNGLSKYTSESFVSELGSKVEVNQVKRVPTEKPVALFNPTSMRHIGLFGKKGLPLRPLKTSALLPRPSGSLVSQTQNTFEKIVQSIQETFPGYSRSSISKIIEELRKENGGSLSGITEEMLTRLIAERILESDGVHVSGHTAYSPEELLSGHRPRSVNDSYCTICHEPIHYHDALTLDCHHKFHASCIQKWFGEDHSCPNCRKHVLLKEEFPSLR